MSRSPGKKKMTFLGSASIPEAIREIPRQKHGSIQQLALYKIPP